MDCKQVLYISNRHIFFNGISTVHRFSYYALTFSELFYNALSVLTNCECTFTSHYQAQMRDLSGFVETRQQLLTLKSNHRMNWIGFAVAHHLNSRYDLCV